MPDVLIRDLPEDVVTTIDSQAAKLGVSRSEYLRRRLSQDARRVADAVTVADLERFATVFPDLSEPEVITRAWE